MAGFSLPALKAELLSDPMALGYAPLIASGAHARVAAILAEPNYTIIRPLPILTLLTWCAATGVRANIEDFVDAQKGLPAGQAKSPAFGACLAMQDSFWGAFAGSHVFVLDEPAIGGPGGMLDGMVAAGVMTADQKTQLLALAAGPASRSEVLWGDGTVVLHAQITQALNS